MKTFPSSRVLVTVAIAVASVLCFQSQAGETSVSASVSDNTLPDNIQAGTPAAQVVKLVRAGVNASVIQTYITDCSSAFNLNADKIISLSDAGVPGDMINAMIAHDKNFLASLPTAESSATSNNPPAPPTNVTDTAATVDVSAPAQPVTVNEFYNTLSPYGSWVNVDGYGLCWRPTVVVYDSGWQPYCDRGHWVYTDCGWYWDSDYAWGITFHYGRWFNSPRYGWCWWPDTVWGPSWVTWRSSTDYCGWAPLPPFSVYHPGIGFSYQGRNVSVSFGFGLAANCFTFVSARHFCEPHPRYYRVPPHDLDRIYHHTAVCNDYKWHNRNIVNNGVSVTIIGSATHRPIRAVSIGSLVNVHRDGWRGHSERYERHEGRPFGTSNANGSERRGYVDNGYHHENNPSFGRENGHAANRETTEHHDYFNFNHSAPAMNHRDAHQDRDHSSMTERQPGHSERHDQRFVSDRNNINRSHEQAAVQSHNNNSNHSTRSPANIHSSARYETRNAWMANNDRQ